MDFFQPFTHTTYSVGVIYCVVLNLPREFQYKVENVIVVSIIPGPHEPKLNINTFLKPLVEEMQDLYDGIALPCTSGVLKQRHIRACIACLAADIPASQKICCHNTRLGCNKCYNEFLSENASFEDKPNYGGFNLEMWERRTNSKHRESCDEIKATTNKTQLQKLESAHGVRYSYLLKLTYFNPVKFVVINSISGFTADQW